jgi:hypothetical protein
MSIPKKVIIFSALFSLVSLSASGEEIVLGENFSTSESVKQVESGKIDSIELEIDGPSANLQMYEVNRTFDDQYSYLIPFASYRIESSNTNITRVSVKFDNESVDQFLENVDKHRTYLWGITRPAGRALTFSNRNISYKLEVTSVGREMRFSAVVFRQPSNLNELKTAINPSETDCNRYWSPNSSYQIVNGSCVEFRDNQSQDGEELDKPENDDSIGSDNKSVLVLTVIAMIILVYIMFNKVLFLYAKYKVEQKTSEVLDHDDLSVDQDTLDEVERANNSLIEGDAAKALRIINDIG